MARAGRPTVEVELGDDERDALERWTRRPKRAQSLALRCRIVLECATGATNGEVAETLGVHPATVGKWRRRIAVDRLDGLHDEPRPGVPRSITDDDVERVIVMTLEETPTDATHWSTRSMAKATGMSQSGISRIWRAFGLKPHLRETFNALDLASGKVIADMTDRHRAVEFRKFLNLINRSVPDDLDVHLIIDNVSTHKTPEIHRWLLRHPRFHLHFTPTYSSWMNMVERWFAELTEKWLRRGTHRSTKELKDSIAHWVQQWNDDPRPFVWHKSADEILTTLASYTQRISDSGH